MTVDKKDLRPLYRYITDDEAFSPKHFIISNNDQNIICFLIEEREETYTYEKQFFKKYVNSLFNFIFIPSEINSELKNRSLPRKLNLMKQKEIQCSYLRMYLEHVQSLGESMEEATRDPKRYKDDLDLYFSRDFKEQYVQFARDLLKEVIEKVRDSR